MIEAESDLIKKFRVYLSKLGFVAFRNNTGMAWQGDARRLPNGALLIVGPRPIRFGLFKGSSDLIAWKSVIITPDMVGKKVAVFSVIEGKNLKGKAADEQKTFLANVRDAGGISILARQESDIEEGLNEWIRRK